MNYLKDINSPNDLKKLKIEDLNPLSIEIKNAILNRVSKIGGHVGPNLGITEAIIALHYVFNAPLDKIVFDVSHQSYAHKILTGRKNGFLNESDFSLIGGYTKPDESEYDLFTVGHTSTSISLATGLACARDIQKQKHNVVAIIGDGSLGGGEALEGLNTAGELNTNLIIIVNDNEMSIAPNHGGLYKNLKELRETKGLAPTNIFKSFGLDYVYVEEGNNIEKLIQAFQLVKNIDHPIVVHIHTNKGCGYKFAEEEKEKWHFNAPFDIKTGKHLFQYDEENYNTITTNWLLEKMEKDNRVVVVNAGTPGAIGFTQEKREKAKERFIDVGIAEEQGVAMASALAKGGCKPVFWVLSSFVQRTYDQLSQDLALNKNPAVILVSWTGISSNDATHLGVFDIPMISNIPNLVHLAPTCKEEYLAMLDWAIEQEEYPVVIRVPSIYRRGEVQTFNKTDIETMQIEKEGKDIAIIGVGSFYWMANEIYNRLKEEGFQPTLINPRYVHKVDEKMLDKIQNKHKLVITLEDGLLDGGYGQKVATCLASTDTKVLCYGAKKEFTDCTPMNVLYERYKLVPEMIVCEIKNIV